MSERVTNEADIELTGIVGINSFLTNTSPSRLAMVAGHFGQHLLTEGMTVNRFATGVTRELSKYVHDIRFPCDALVLKLIHKYPRTIGAHSIEENPVTTVIYEDVKSPKRTIGVINIETHHCLHQYFGFKYVMKEYIMPEHAYPKDTVIATSPAVTPEGEYMYGIGAKVALMSHPCGIEDGIRVSEEFCLANKTKGYGKRILAWNKSTIPLNMHGDLDNYKFIPDIGERVGPSGLIFATRKIVPGKAAPLMSRKALRKLDLHDKTTYAAPNAKVIDVIVYKGNNNKSNLPKGMDEQCQFYYKKASTYYNNIIDEYKRLNRDRNGECSITPEFQTLLRNSLAYTQVPEKRHITPMYSRQEIQEWVIEVIFEYDIIPGVGYKFSGIHGDKNIVVSKVPRSEMPRDAAGNYADIIKDAYSVVKRMNIGCVIETYINASADKLRSDLEREYLSGQYDYPKLLKRILGWYEIVAPLHYDNVIECLNLGVTTAQEEVDSFIRDGHHSYVPPNNPVDYMDACHELSLYYPPVHGPVTFKGIGGGEITTVENVLIGEQYIMMLEKIGNTWSSTSSAKLNHFGIPAKLTNSDKFSSPIRDGATRITGEGEVRLIYAVSGGLTIADIIDQSVNPTVHRQISNNIITAQHPTNINEVIDRVAHPIGSGRPLNFVKHLMLCSGKEFVLGVAE